jgi:hypothetical protein
LRLLEYVPLDTESPIDGKFANDVSIDSHFFFHDTDGVATRLGVIELGTNSLSFRDIVKLLSKFLKDAKIEELVVAQGKSTSQILRGNGHATMLIAIIRIYNFLLRALYLISVWRH